MNFFKLYMGDYQRDTGALSIAEHGAYFLMLQYHYATEKPLPIGKDLYRLIRCETKSEKDAVDEVARLYWRATPEGLVNDRALKEMGKAADQAETNRRIAVEREAQRRAERIVHEACSDREPNHNQTLEPKAKPPEPDGSLDAIWTEGVSLLKANRMAESTARSFIGMLCKRFETNDVADAIQSAAGKADPKGYIQAILKTKPTKGAPVSRATFD